MMTSTAKNGVDLAELLKDNPRIFVSLLSCLRIGDAQRLSVSCQSLLATVMSSKDKLVVDTLAWMKEMEALYCIHQRHENEATHAVLAKISTSIRKYPRQYRIVEMEHQYEISKSLLTSFSDPNSGGFPLDTAFDLTNTCQAPWNVTEPREMFHIADGHFMDGYPDESFDYVPARVRKEEPTNESKRPTKKRKKYDKYAHIKEFDALPKRHPKHTNCSSIFCQKENEKDEAKDYLLFYIREKPYCSYCLKRSTFKKIMFCSELQFPSHNPILNFQLVENSILYNEQDHTDVGPCTIQSNEFCVRIYQYFSGLDGPGVDMHFIGIGPRFI